MTATAEYASISRYLAEVETAKAISPPRKKADATSTFEKYPDSEFGNATLLAARFGDKLRFNSQTKLWMSKQSSGVWKEDLSNSVALQAFREIVDERKKMAETLPDSKLRKDQLKWCEQCDSLRIGKSSIGWAESLPEFATDPLKLDADPWMLGTPVGIFDLRTGRISTSKTEHWITKSTSASPAETADCPTWKKFLSDAMQGDQERIDYLQRLAGYCLTGTVREHSLVWFVGSGGNGKSTFLDNLAAIFGDHGWSMRTEPLLASKHDVHPTELADLKGKRLVIASELDEGRVWRESRLKMLTGGDPICARKVHKDAITFLPSHKLIISANSRPQLATTGEAERRRLQLVEWRTTFRNPASPSFVEGRDCPTTPNFEQLLEAERPAILRWALDGCLMWIRDGLNPPESVIASSEDYLAQMDSLQQFIDECCDVNPIFQSVTADLWQHFVEWCRPQRLDPGPSINTFGSKLVDKGFRRGRTESARTIRGVKLKSESGEQSSQKELTLQ